MKKLVALALSVIMVLSMVCVAAADDGVVLKVVGWDVNTTAYYAAQKEAFEASHPGITIEYIDVASQDYGTKTGTMLAGGDTSDIFMIKEVTDIMNWNKAGYVEPLNAYMERDNYDVSGFVGMENGYAFDGVQAGLPFRSDFWVLFYNKTLFDEAGVDYPTNDMTWEQYKELAIKMTDPAKNIYGCHYHTWLSAVVNWAVCDGVNTLVDGEYSDLEYFYNLYFELEEAGATMSIPETRAAGLHYSGAFGNGNIAMMPMGYWYVSTLITNIKDGTYEVKDWGITAVPHKEDVAPASSFGNLTGAMVNSKSANKDAAWTYVAWLCGPEGAKATAGTGNRPAWVSEDVAAVMSSVEGFPTDEASKAALIPSAVSIEIPGDPNASAISTILNEEHSAIISREISVEDGILNMNDRVAEVLGK